MGGDDDNHDMEDTMKKGMNPEAVEQMGTRITEAGEQARQIYTQVQGRVSELDWTGEDRDQFVSEFESELGQMIDQLVQRTTELSDSASRNANAQREASA
ncbi:WXG100 family type VII secretion target [Brachybacterium fresconis]|uniref:Uncharacterized protein YukE n=1 Tax=Brachybacterium fresconis TaxID=173363 RepID=A0ABS4YHL1_9MICO|nr:WXG100 family type VII secretion target [Brachybacterium fresconis]MBP2408277.1 uncharacterized protein YukE [Brachybacterium fresconis]MBP2408279.1 uncharacterized protein YukE [Brachybacterium fresconis]